MWVVENPAGHHPPRGSVEEEETLLGALVGVPGGGGGNLLNDVLDLVHDVAGQGRNQIVIAVIGGADTVTAKKSLNMLEINFGPVLVERRKANVAKTRGRRRRQRV